MIFEKIILKLILETLKNNGIFKYNEDYHKYFYLTQPIFFEFEINHSHNTEVINLLFETKNIMKSDKSIEGIVRIKNSSRWKISKIK